MPLNSIASEDSSPSLFRPVNTRELLEHLGFQPIAVQFTDQQPGFLYRFGNLDLEACQVTSESFRAVMLFTGVYSTPRTLGMVEFSLPMTLESFEQGVALLAHNIGRQFTPTNPPPWLELGRTFEDYLPWRQELKLFEKRPQCKIEADRFKVAAKRLIAYGLAANGTEQFAVSFAESVVKFQFADDALVMPARGMTWATTYCCKAHGLRHLSKRTPAEGVDVEFWKDNLSIGRLRLAAQTSETNLPISTDELSIETISESVPTEVSVWIPEGRNLSEAHAQALMVQARSKPSRSIYLDLMASQLQKLVNEDKAEAISTLQMSAEHLPELYLIAQNNPVREYGRQIVNSDSFQTLLNKVDWTLPGRMSEKKIPSLRETLEQLP